MFESEDWDFDEDFLKDVDNKALQYYSQADSKSETVPVKRRKLDSNNDSIFATNNVLSTTCKKTFDGNKESSDTSRKNLMLDILKKGLKNDTQKESNTSSTSRKNLVLDILQKGNSKVCDDNVSGVDPKNIDKAQKQCQENNILHKQQFNSTNKNLRVTWNKINKHNNASTSETRKNAYNDLKYSKDNAVEETTETCILNTKKHTDSFDEMIFPPIKAAKVYTEKMTLVRKFPGPAGLLPDIANENDIPPASYLKSLDENDNAKREVKSHLSNYCSQNTKYLFTQGAWQIMLNDLPRGFLENYEIARIKETADTGRRQSMKIPFLAGILEQIDYSYNNPRIVLRDFTDSIQGTMHCDIPQAHPGVFEPNVVLLLQNPGLLRMSGSTVADKYCLLISPLNLVSVYSEKGRIAETHLLHSISGVDTLSEEAVNESRNQCKHNDQTDKLDISMSDDELELKKIQDKQHVRITHTNNTSTETKDIFENFDWSDSLIDDFNFSIEHNSTTDSQCNKETTENNVTKGIERRKSLLQNLKEFSYVNSKASKISTVKNASVHDQSMINRSPKKIDAKEMKVSEKNLRVINKENLKTPKTSTNSKPSPLVKSKLLQFRSNDVLTPLESANTLADSNTEIEEKLPCKTDFSANILSSSNDDSDDEILSQIDIDSIAGTSKQSH